MRLRFGDLRKLIESSRFIDARNAFSARRADILRKKVSAVVDDFPDALRRHDEVIKQANQILNDIKDIPDSLINQRRLRIAAPIAFDVDEGWGVNTDVFTVISHTYPNSEDYEQLRMFVISNDDKFISSIHMIDEALSSIEKLAVTESWPKSWKRYSQWSSITSAVSRYKQTISKMLRGI